jgi:predicted metal-dependent hydrolase
VTQKYIFSYIDKISDTLYPLYKSRKSRFTEDNKVFYLGKQYTIKYGDKFYILDDTLYLDRQNPKKSFFSKKNDFIKYLQQLMQKYSKEINIEGIIIKIRQCESVHGSYNKISRTILISTNILTYPEHLIDYVIAHELAHTEYLNHSPSFHDLLEKILPNALSLRKEIIQYDRYINKQFND